VLTYRTQFLISVCKNSLIGCVGLGKAHTANGRFGASKSESGLRTGWWGGEVSVKPSLTTKNTKVHKGKPDTRTLAIEGVISGRSFADADPGLQFAGSTEQADARSLKFEIRVLQCVVTLVSLTARIVQIV